MTTTAPTTHAVAPRSSGGASRILPVARLHFTNKWTVIGTPLLILAFIWAVNFVIWLLIWQGTSPADRADAMEGTQYSGAVFYIYVYMMVIAVQTMLRTFPFALGFSVTRRDFALGTAVFYVLLSAFYAIVTALLSVIEVATNGWGVGGRMFSSIYFGEGAFGVKVLVSFCAFVFFFFVGAVVATLYLRWRAAGLTWFFVGLTVIVVGLAALATFTASWSSVGGWFASVGPTGVILWSLVPTVLAALFGFVILRRATPTA